MALVSIEGDKILRYNTIEFDVDNDLSYDDFVREFLHKEEFQETFSFFSDHFGDKHDFHNRIFDYEGNLNWQLKFRMLLSYGIIDEFVVSNKEISIVQNNFKENYRDTLATLDRLKKELLKNKFLSGNMIKELDEKMIEEMLDRGSIRVYDEEIIEAKEFSISLT